VRRPRLTKPGLFITATDTEVGKTVASCAIAASLRRSGLRVGVCKPIASGCRHEREGLVSPDAEALAHFADCREPLHLVNPVRYAAPLAPAVAAEQTEQPVDWPSIAESLERLDQAHDLLIVEGIGGWLVPLDSKQTVADLARWVGYPAVVVTRANLGTLNHTALTCAAVRNNGTKLAGVIINRYRTDDPDPSVVTNPRWLARQSRTQVLATLPDADGVAVQAGRLPEAVIEAAGMVDWQSIACKRCDA
jgi:dethiobiotin synthetase